MTNCQKISKINIMNKLKRFYAIDKPNDGLFTLSGQEFIHAKNVMRLREKDQIIICCGDGIDYICEICQTTKDEFICKIIGQEQNLCDSKISITLYQAQVKADKLELIAQKVSEIGITKLVPFTSEFCVVQGELSKQKLERLNKIAIESAKQCGRSQALIIENNRNFDAVVSELDAYDLVIFAYENAKTERIGQIVGKYKDIAVIVGSEGGFSQSECEKLCSLPNVHCITLGRRILRAETAAIVSCALVMEKFENIDN